LHVPFAEGGEAENSVSANVETGMADKRKHERARLEDIAREAAVSTMTVSRALRGLEGVSTEKRNEIIVIARRLSYIPDLAARAMAEAGSDLVGISLPTLFNDVFADMLDGMRGVFDHASLSTVVGTTDYVNSRENAWVERLLSWRPAGLVLTGCDHSEALHAMLADSGLPIVEIWDWRADAIDICVGIDHFGAGFELGRHIKALGYRRPGFVGCQAGIDTRAEARLKGIATAFDRPVETGRSEKSGAFELGYEGASRLVAATSELDVVFCLNDHVAFGAWMCLQAMGLQVPRDVGLVGFNALGLTSVLSTRLTTVSTPRRQLGVLAAECIIARRHGVRGRKNIKLPVRFLAGETTTMR
jgi:LacI family gluconate utilization system Gnt-I transcriptional repressor